MHNLKTNFDIFYDICKTIFKDEVNRDKNFRNYPIAPKMDDLTIISLSCCMETLCIDSENLFWHKLKNDYSTQFPHMIDRSRFNRRRRRLQHRIAQIQKAISERLTDESHTLIIDSIPVPVVKLAREKSYRICKKDFETAPAKGYSSVNKGWFIGYKLHLIIYDNGVIQQSGVTKGNVHDINYLKSADFTGYKKELIGDRAYISKPVQVDLFSNYEIKLQVPLRINQCEYKKYPKKNRAKRQMIETVFAQLCDQFNLKRNYAKSFQGLLTRLTSKISAVSILNWLNYLNGRKLSKIKYALCF